MKTGTKGTSSKASRAHEQQPPNPIAVRVGAGIRLRRSMLGLSQEKLGEALELVTAYDRIDDPDIRHRLRDLAIALVGSDQPRQEDDEARSDIERPERENDWFVPEAAEIGMAFKAAADQLLVAVEQALTEVRAEREKTREILDRLDERLAPHG
jgi:hypothetical protein